jgi:hypothetical protein
VLHPFEVLGVGHQPLVHPVLVARAPGLHLLDVGVAAALVAGEVVDADPGVTRLRVDLGALGQQLGELLGLGQRAELVAQLVEAGVELLDVEQLQLGERVGFQRGLLGSTGGPVRFAGVPVAVRVRPGRSTGR